MGFWDGDTLVAHTIRVKPGQYQRADPDYSEQTSTVERLRMTNPDTTEDQVTVWDPQSLTKPWHVVHTYVRVKTPGSRIDMWSCEENNNVVKNGHRRIPDPLARRGWLQGSVSAADGAPTGGK